MQNLRAVLKADHERLDTLLAAALDDPAAYDEFRKGLLRHIGIEEKVLFPEMRRVLGPTDLERALHRDHAALAVLLVPPPTAKEIDAIREILTEHNPMEENDGGMYDIVEQLPGLNAEALMERVHGYPEVPTMPNADSEFLRNAIDKILRERRA